jgi:hypothetical protein
MNFADEAGWSAHLIGPIAAELPITGKRRRLA